MEPKQEYILIVGEVVFHEQENPDNVNAIRVNGIMMSDTTNIGVYAMGKAQQVLQANFFKKVGNNAFNVVDVILINFIQLGRMTAEEFQRMPEGLKFQEKVSETVAATATVPTTTDALDQAVAAANEATKQ